MARFLWTTQKMSLIFKSAAEIYSELISALSCIFIKLFQPSVAFHIENNLALQIKWNQMNDFYMKCNTELKWVNSLLTEFLDLFWEKFVLSSRPLKTYNAWVLCWKNWTCQWCHGIFLIYQYNLQNFALIKSKPLNGRESPKMICYNQIV